MQWPYFCSSRLANGGPKRGLRRHPDTPPRGAAPWRGQLGDGAERRRTSDQVSDGESREGVAGRSTQGCFPATHPSFLSGGCPTTPFLSVHSSPMLLLLIPKLYLSPYLPTRQRDNRLKSFRKLLIKGVSESRKMSFARADSKAQRRIVAGHTRYMQCVRTCSPV